ncbi:hypothetical protein [Paenibacillus sp. HW567]|uniref:hypothetical protein n=1 Tax=Paenibacillus sp. HW567 TaxID=1034769 RepID=UPI0003734003|nr:hypothetical protein [Paenibacillus sp. HW567]
MKVFIKKLGLWLPLLSLIVCLYNLSGRDDKNLLLAFTNPLLIWLNPQLTDLHYLMKNELLWQLILYAIHFFSWLIVGLVLDWGFSRKRSKNKTT